MTDAGGTSEALSAVGLRPPKAEEEVVEVTQHDTFGSWQEQLWLGVRAGRYADVEAIASLRSPSHVVLRHVSVGTYRERARGDGRGAAVESTEQAHRDELLPVAEAATVTSCKPLRRLPRPGSWRGRRLRRKLLREPFEFAGSCLFWVEGLEVLQLLERLGADTDDPGWMGTPLLVDVAEKGLHEVVRFLVEERGHSPNARREDGGYSALHWARELVTVRYLVGRGGDASALTTWGDSVLAQQLRHDHVGNVDYLLSLGDRRASRAQLLHWLGVQPEMVRVLIRHGVDLSRPIERRFGERHRPRPLQRVLRTGVDKYLEGEKDSAREAIANRLVDCMELLLEGGADPRARDCSNRLPYHLVEDAPLASRDPLRRRLERLLSPFGGPREDPPPPPRCTCGLNL